MNNRYLFNPFTIATCMGRPTSVFTNCAILYAIAQAVSGKPITSMLALGLASYLSLYPALLLPPLVLLCYDRKASEKKPPPNATISTATYLSVFSASIAWFLHLSKFLTGGSWEYLASTYGVHLLLPDLTPNVGLWWYFFIEMFDSFREFFLGVFWLHLGCYVGALCIRLRAQPLFVITTLLGIFAIFKPYPSISDTSLYFAMLPLYRHIFPRMSSPLRAIEPCLHHPPMLIFNSNAIHLFCHGHNPVHVLTRPCLLLSLDIRRFRQRKLLLCHHPRLEPRPVRDRRGFALRCTPGRMGGREAGDEGQNHQTDIAKQSLNIPHSSVFSPNFSFPPPLLSMTPNPTTQPF